MSVKILMGAAGTDIDAVLSKFGAVCTSNPEAVLMEKESNPEVLALILKMGLGENERKQFHDCVPKIVRISSADLRKMAEDGNEPEFRGQFRKPNRMRRYDAYGRTRR
jgi:hypothetical protein